MSIMGLIGRIITAIIEQPGATDVATAIARRIFKQASTRIVHAINQRTKLRKGPETFH